jgi:hypothetical protein
MRLSKHIKWTLPLALLITLGIVVTVQALTLIDTFNDTAQTSDFSTTPCTSASVPGTDILGSERDILVNRTSGSGTVVADADTTVANQFSLSIGASTRGTALIQWDGADGACTLNATGLSGISLSPDDGLAIHVSSVDLNGAVTMYIYTDASNYSTYTYVIPNSIASPGYVIYFPFEQFTAVNSGADYADVGAIELFIDGTGIESLDMTIDFVHSDYTRDFGDLPAAYNNITLFANNGARHSPDTVYYGSAIDTEADGQTSATATGDNTSGSDDEQGLAAVTGSNWGDGGGQIALNATVPSAELLACAVGWIDWDNSGSFDTGGTTGGVSELVFNTTVLNGASTQNITTPTTADYGGSYPATLNARFRIFQRNADLFTTLGLTLDGIGCPTGESEANIAGLLTGLARNGEVEDYQWGFAPNAVTLSDTGTKSAPIWPALAAGTVSLVGVGTAVFVHKRRKAQS